MTDTPTRTPPHARVLVTGGAGFIGSHLCARLVTDGARVTVLDDFSTGSRDNLLGLDVAVVEGSTSDPSLAARLVGETDLVVHLASTVGVGRVMRNRMRTLENGAHGVMTVMDAAAPGRVPVVFASTSEVYGDAETMPLAEDDVLRVGPSSTDRWGYAAAKVFGEFIALAQHRERGSPAMALRFFNTVGPRQAGRYGMVLPRFVGAALAGTPLLVHGDGTQRRCFTAVSDAVEAMARLIAAPAAWGQVVNVGGQAEISILDLARMVLEETGSAAPLRFVPHAEVFGPSFSDIRRRVPDVTRLAHLTGFRPATPVRESLRRVIAAMRG